MSRPEHRFGFGTLAGLSFFFGTHKIIWAASAGSGGFPREVFWQIVSFTLLVMLLGYVLKKPLRSFLMKRREEIKSSLEQAAQKEEKAGIDFGEWEAKMQALTKEIGELHERISQEGETERQRMTARAMDESERIKKQAQLVGQQEIKKARATLRKEVVGLSIELAETILRETTQLQDQERLVKDYIEKVRELR
jgi:F-type H+-transporting ATPase subunit b